MNSGLKRMRDKEEKPTYKNVSFEDYINGTYFD